MYKTDHDVVLGIAIRATDALIGATGLHQIDYKNRHAQLGIMIGNTHEWRKGYGTEATALTVAFAFDTLNLNRVWLHVYETNAHGIRAYEKSASNGKGCCGRRRFATGAMSTRLRWRSCVPIGTRNGCKAILVWGVAGRLPGGLAVLGGFEPPV